METTLIKSMNDKDIDINDDVAVMAYRQTKKRSNAMVEADFEVPELTSYKPESTNSSFFAPKRPTTHQQNSLNQTHKKYVESPLFKPMNFNTTTPEINSCENYNNLKI